MDLDRDGTIRADLANSVASLFAGGVQPMKGMKGWRWAVVAALGFVLWLAFCVFLVWGGE